MLWGNEATGRGWGSSTSSTIADRSVKEVRRRTHKKEYEALIRGYYCPRIRSMVGIEACNRDINCEKRHPEALRDQLQVSILRRHR